MRGFCFTLNNPKDNHGAKLRIDLQAIASYGIIGREIAPTTGTPHYQGYVSLPDNYNIKMLKPLNKAVHWAYARGTWEQNRDYCSKHDKNPLIWGREPQQGSRQDLQAVVTALESGMPAEEIPLVFPLQYIKFHSGIDKMIEARYKHRMLDTPPTVYWLYGDSGAGKSMYSYTRWGPEQVYMMHDANEWTGYTQQTCILVDDFEEGCISYRRMLNLLDRYPLKKNKKYGSVKINSSYIVITSEHHPVECFPDLHRNSPIQLLRRIDKIVKYEIFENFKKSTVISRPKKEFSATGKVSNNGYGTGHQEEVLHQEEDSIEAGY